MAAFGDTASQVEVVVDGQRRMVAETLRQEDRFAQGQRRDAGRGQVVVDATKNL